MKYKIQSDKNIKIFTTINIFTNINFDHDIALNFNCLKIKNNQNYIFKTTFLKNEKKDLTNQIYIKCSEKNYLNIILFKNSSKKIDELIFKNLIYLNYVFGKKIIIFSDKNPILIKSDKIEEFIFYNRTKKFEIKNIMKITNKIILSI